MRAVGAIILVASLVLTADAQTCGVRVRYEVPVYYQQRSYSYQHYPYTYRVASVDYHYPYSNYLVTNYPGGGDLQLKNELLQLRVEVLNFKLQVLQGGQLGTGGTIPKMSVPNGNGVKEQGQVQVTGARLRLFSAECSACHDGDKGQGKLALTLNGGTQLAPLTYEQAASVIYVLYAGETRAGKKMPPSGKKMDDVAVGGALVDPSPQK